MPLSFGILMNFNVEPTIKIKKDKCHLQDRHYRKINTIR